MLDTPYFVIDKIHGRCLMLGGDGSYDGCVNFLQELQRTFGARFTKHWEAGPRPDSDKEKGYWDVEMFGQQFGVMRTRGDGICLWGPKPPAAIDGFLRVCQHFGAVQRKSFLGRALSWLPVWAKPS